MWPEHSLLSPETQILLHLAFTLNLAFSFSIWESTIFFFFVIICLPDVFLEQKFHLGGNFICLAGKLRGIRTVVTQCLPGRDSLLLPGHPVTGNDLLNPPDVSFLFALISAFPWSLCLPPEAFPVAPLQES